MTLAPRPLGRRGQQLLLFALILFFILWDLWAVLTDNRVAPFDTVLESLPEDDLFQWLRSERKGPLVPLVVTALRPLVGDLLLAARVLSILAHGLTLWLVWGVTRRHTSSWVAGALAVLLCGALPGVYGWYRMEYHDASLALVVMLTLYLMTWQPLTRWRAVMLGLTVGIGVLVKPGYVVYVLAPGVIFLVLALRDAAARRHLALGLAVALMTTGWWALLTGGTLIQYAIRSSEAVRGGERELMDQLDLCFSIIPAPLVLLTVVAALFAWFSNRRLSFVLLLFGSCFAITLPLMLLVFDTISRYFVPLGPVAAVLMAMGLLEVGRKVRPHLSAVTARGLLMVGALALVALFCAANISGTGELVQEREGTSGMVRPDGRPYTKIPDAVRLVRQRGWPLVGLLDTERHCGELDLVWRSRGVMLPLASEELAPRLIQAARPVYLVLCHGPGPVLPQLRGDGVLAQVNRQVAKRIRAGGVRVMRSFSNPDQSYLSILQLPAK